QGAARAVASGRVAGRVAAARGGAARSGPGPASVAGRSGVPTVRSAPTVGGGPRPRSRSMPPVHHSPLRGRTAVVTGAARGLGEAMARDLSARGAKVALLGREESTLARVRDTLPGVSRCWAVDVTDDRGMARVAAEIGAALGPPSVVVANAGVAEGGPFETSDPAVWRRVVEVNLIGSAVTARAFLPALFETR